MESFQSAIYFPQFGAAENVTITDSKVKQASSTKCDLTRKTGGMNATSYTTSSSNSHPECNEKRSNERFDNKMNQSELNRESNTNTDSNKQFEYKSGYINSNNTVIMGMGSNYSKKGTENNDEISVKYQDSIKVYSSSSSHHVREYIEVLDDSDSDDYDEIDLNTSTTNNKSKTLPQRTVIEIDDDSDSNIDDDDDIVFVGVHNQTKINLEQKLKAASEERERKLLKQESFQKAQATRSCQTNNTCSTTFVKKTNVPIVPGGSRKRSYSYKKPLQRKPRGRDFYDVHRLGAMEEQERLFREAANRVRSNHEENRRRQEELSQMKTTNNHNHIISDIVHDVTTLPIWHWTWKDPWSRLGVPPGTSLDIVKRNYRKLLLLYHPDKNLNNNRDDASCTNRFLAIKEAYEIITTRMDV